MDDDAICIRHWDWSETSQTVSLFTRNHGTIRGLAKGSKRENTNFSGGIELLTLGHVHAIVKPTTELATLTAWDLNELFPAVRRSLASFYAGMYIADLLHHAVHDHDPHAKLFDATLDALRNLDQADGKPALAVFQWELLVEMGYQPQLDTDARTTEPLAKSSTYAFLPRQGGFTAGSQVPADAPAWKLRGETLEILRVLASPAALAPISAAPSEQLARANRLLAAYLRELLSTDLPSAKLAVGALSDGRTHGSP